MFFTIFRVINYHQSSILFNRLVTLSVYTCRLVFIDTAIEREKKEVAKEHTTLLLNTLTSHTHLIEAVRFSCGIFVSKLFLYTNLRMKTRTHDTK